MAKLQSQWEFGDLLAQPPAPKAPALPPQAPTAQSPAAPAPGPAPQPPARRVFSVTELTQTVKRLLEQHVGRVWVTGEITNARLQSSGHLYFTIKDGSAQLSCVFFRGEARTVNRDLLRDGVKVNLQGELTVYEARGQYQLIVTWVEMQGVGALQVAFEKLKLRLQAEGLFAPERKRALPKYPQRIGIVTSRSGAAIRDVLQAIGRRHPGLELILASCRVQGQGAGEEIACALQLLNEWSGSGDPARRIDLILVTRGGGSLEDLWAFNEEVVARAIFRSEIPVISGVGHEIDFTIADFVADFRAATPSAAAEIITEGFFASRPGVTRAAAKLRQLIRDQIENKAEEIAFLTQRLQRQHPIRWLQEQWQHLDDLQSSLLRSGRFGFRGHQSSVQSLAQRLWRVKPSQILARHRDTVQGLQRDLRDRTQRQLAAVTQRLASAQSKLHLLSPENVLDRGYSITQDAITGSVIRSATEVQPGQILRTRLKQGEMESVVESEVRGPKSDS